MRPCLPLALLLALAWPGAPAWAAAPPPPASEAEPLVETLHGQAVADPYRWLEEGQAPRVRAWVEAQRAHAQAGLAALGGQGRWKARILELSQGGAMEAPFRAGPRWFCRRSDGRSPQSHLAWRQGLSGPWRVAYDPNREDPSGLTSLDSVSVAPDGRWIALWTSKGGSERSELRFLDLDRGRFLPERLPEVGHGSLAWLGGGLLAYTGHAGEPGKSPHQLKLHRLGQPAASDRVHFTHPEGPSVLLGVQSDEAARFVIISAYRGSSGGVELWLWDRARPGLPPFPLVRGFGAQHGGELRGGDWVELTNEGAPMGAIVSFPLASQRPGQALKGRRTLVPEGPHRLLGFSLVGPGLVLQHQVLGRHELSWHDAQGRRLGQVPLPSPGTVRAFWGEPGRPWLTFQHAGPTTPTGTHAWRWGQQRLWPLAQSPVRTRPESFELKTLTFASADGTRIPVEVLQRKGLQGPAPTWLYGYGGFDQALSLRFSGPTYAWLEAGGRYALAHLRGGGEFGEAWHRAGMFAGKPKVFEDWEAIARGLVAEGWCRPEQLGIEGASNGGLLVAAALARHPELYGAAVCKVPLTDMIRFPRFLVGKYWISEYGDPEKAEDFRHLLGYSPYHQLRPGLRYPPTWITAGEADGRVDPLHARKFAARLQAAQAGPAPIWYLEEQAAGHGAGKPLHRWAEGMADQLAFMAAHLGLATPPPSARPSLR